VILGLAMMPQFASAAKATPTPTLQQIQAQQKAAKAKEEAALKEQQRQAKLKAEAERRSEEAEEQIVDIEAALQQNLAKQSETRKKIEEQNQTVAKLDSDLSLKERQRDALLRELYIQVQTNPEELRVFSGSDFSQQERTQVQLDQLWRAADQIMLVTRQQRSAVEVVRSGLEKQQDSLINFQKQREVQAQSLETLSKVQEDLARNAEKTIAKLDKDVEAARKQQADLEAKANAALAAIVSKRNQQRSVGSIPSQERGASVKRGDLVGIQGSTGFSTGDHVHYRVTKNGSTVNPMPYIDAGVLGKAMNSYKITQGYGRTSFSYVYATNFHDGVDFSGPKGSGVYSPCDGDVLMKTNYGSYGLAWAVECEVDFQGETQVIQVLYGHLSS
jgi:septal ring factor EnvC (AmiA/AmiB activator)